MIKRKKGILKICTMLLTGALLLSGCSSNSNGNNSAKLLIQLEEKLL